MKIDSIYHSKEARRKECKGDRTEKKYSKDPVHHPMLLEREYVRALNAVKIERMLAKPFVTALSHHREGINKMAKDTNSSLFVTSSYDNRVILCDLATREIVKEKQFAQIINGIATDRNANTFVSQENEVFFNDIPQFRMDSTVSSIDLSDDLSVGTSDGIFVFDLNRQTPKIRHTIDGVTAVKFNSSFKYIMGGLTRLSINLLDNRSSKEFLEIAAPGTNCISFSPQKGYVFACGNDDGNGYLYDIRNSEHPIETYRGHTNSVVSVAFSPHGEEIATGSFDRTIRMFRIDERKPRDCYYNDRMQIVHAVEYSNDGEFIVSGSDDGSLRLWKTQASKKLGPVSRVEKEALQYTEALKEKYKGVEEISRISRHRFLNKEIKREMHIRHEMHEGSKRRQAKSEKEAKQRSKRKDSD